MIGLHDDKGVMTEIEMSWWPTVGWILRRTLVLWMVDKTDWSWTDPTRRKVWHPQQSGTSTGGSRCCDTSFVHEGQSTLQVFYRRQRGVRVKCKSQALTPLTDLRTYYTRIWYNYKRSDRAIVVDGCTTTLLQQSDSVDGMRCWILIYSNVPAES